MHAAGINYRLQQTILLPDFVDIRGTASCQFWLVEAVEMVYGTLE